MDANFRLKNQLVSNFSIDPGLGIGMSYMVQHEDYEGYVKSREKDPAVSLPTLFMTWFLLTGLPLGRGFKGLWPSSCRKSPHKIQQKFTLHGRNGRILWEK